MIESAACSFELRYAPRGIGSAPTRLSKHGRAEHRSVADRGAPTSPRRCAWRILHNVPNRLHRHAISPCPSSFVDSAEQFSSINSSRGEPIVEFGSHPIRNWNCSNVASLADQINNGSMLFALLE